MVISVKTFCSGILPSNAFAIYDDNVTCKRLKDEIAAATGIPSEQFKLYQEKEYLLDENLIQYGKTVYMLLELKGGKGGFGSMLRAIGAQIEKTTNKEACRDLSGRRLRDINEEKRLKKWIAKQAERERERAERKQRRLERLRALPPHEFHDPTFDKVYSSLTENVSEAVSQGLENMKKSQGTLKRKATSTVTSAAPKKLQLWNDEYGEESDENSNNSERCDNESDVSDSDNHNSFSTVSKESDETSCESSSRLAQSDASTSCENSSSNHNENTGISSVQVRSSLSPSPSADVLNEASECSSSKKKNEIQDPATSTLELNAYDSIEKLEALGLEVLKTMLTSLGMKCGGTLKERAERLFSVRGLNKEQIDPSLLAKSQKK